MHLKFILTFLLQMLFVYKTQTRSISDNLNQIPKNGIIIQTVCEACDLLIPLARELALKNRTQEIENIAVLVCINLKIEDTVVCNQIVKLFLDSIINVAVDSELSNNELCSAILSCKPIKNPIFNWNITLPDFPKPPVKPSVLPKDESPVVKILHLTDIHIDLEYQPGALAECDQPLCCRNSSTSKLNSKNLNKSAGFWGDYRNCDVPIWTVENMFEHISKEEEFDFIYWTGDLPPHNVWNQSRGDQLNALDVLTDLFLRYFPNKQVYPALGNHEATPCNLFPTPLNKNDNITWLYERLAQDWTKTGLSENLKENITRGAFYTLMIAPGVRLVSLNMNYCSALNFWLYINSTDPLDQLKWLADVLQESENKKEKVHIIGHINPSSCLPSWSFNYYRIVNRYESTITGQFFGHKHNDYVEIFYDLENTTRPLGVAYMSGSTTTYSYLNPSFRIYTVDGLYQNTSWQILDYETKILNITEANLSNNPKWKLEYSPKIAYNMTSLFPIEWNRFVDQSLKNPNTPVAKNFIKNYYNSYDKHGTCDIKCKRNLLCKFKQARPDHLISCKI